MSNLSSCCCSGMSDKFHLKSFCCCCSLKTGSLLIGTIGWLMTLYQLFYLSNPLQPENIKYNDSEINVPAEISYSFVTLVVSIVMIYGIYKNNKNLIFPWIVLKLFECLTWSGVTLYVFMLCFYVQRISGILLLLLIDFSVTTLNWYCWLCVWSLFMEIPETDESTIETAPPEEIRLNKKIPSIFDNKNCEI